MPKSAKRKYFGWVRDLPNAMDAVYKAPRDRIIELPQEVDLRPSFPWPVEDQGPIGSCVAHALASNMEFFKLQLRRLQKKEATPTEFPPKMMKGVRGQQDFFKLSRLFLYYEARARDGNTKNDSGTQIRNGIKALEKVGICMNDLWPYVPQKFANKPPANCYTDALSQRITISQRLMNTSDIMYCLADGTPVVIGMSIFDSFDSPATAKTGVVAMPTTKNYIIGGHSTCIVGYSRPKDYFIVRNSWGYQWGDDGHFYLPIEYLDKFGADFWSIKTGDYK